jgi:peptidyl-prolyl cis-trans isomerase D
MSILERIRNRSGLLIGFVGVALGLFVIQGLLESRGNFGSAGATDVGEIKGEKISIKYFEARVQENVANYKINSQTETVDNNTMESLREQTWNQLVQEVLMNDAYEKLGINVTTDELFEMVQGKDPHPSIKSAPIFVNQQNGQFDRTMVISFLKSISQDPEGEQMKRWLAFEEGIQKERLTQKFNSLIKGGVYVNSLEAKELFMSRNKTVDIKFAGLNYASIADSTVQLSDDDLKKYFDKNISKYKNKERSRKLEFVVFDVFPSGEDSANAQKWAESQVELFRNATNDSAFVASNSDAPYDSTFKGRGQLPPSVEDLLFNAEKGTTVGPVSDNGSFKIYKLSAVQADGPFQMKASHILFKVENNDTAAAVKKANEVLAEIRKGASFEVMAAQYGTDGTAQRGGDLGWFQEGQMVTEFNDAVKRGNKGDMFVVKTQFGPHIVKVTENKSNRKVQVVTVERKIEAGSKTVQAAYNKAQQFAAASRTAEDFDKNSTANNYTKRLAESIKENDRTLPGIENSREAVRWAYREEASRGDVSEVFEAGDKFVVAVLKEMREKDKAGFDDVKTQVTQDATKDKKAEIITEKITAALAQTKDPVALAVKLGTVANDAANQTFENANIPYIGMERGILGTAFGLKANVLSAPIKGDNGVYVILVTKINDVRAPTDMKVFKDELINPLKSRSEFEAFNAMKELSEVKDNRYRFY